MNMTDHDEGRTAAAVLDRRTLAYVGCGVLFLVGGGTLLFAPDAGSAAAPVGYPGNYRADYQPLRSSFKAGKNLVGTTYANPVAASVVRISQLPYAEGSEFVFEWTTPLLDADGAPEVKPDGTGPTGDVVRIDVMRRGSGTADGSSGSWAFASYGPDGSAIADEAELRQCAVCHAKAAARDHVFRGRFPPPDD